MLRQTAHAKINLALQIVGKREDGYHQLNSLVCFTKFGDTLSIDKAPQDSPLVTLEVTGSFANELESNDDNLVMKAAINLAAELNGREQPLSPVKIVLEKNLPIASGIGGGSADAAAAIRLLKEFWDVPPNLDLDEICLQLGADVPMCLHSKPLVAQGIGENLSPFLLAKEFHIVLVNPRIAVSTPEIFKALNFDKSNIVSELDFAHLFNAGEYGKLCNDMQDAAMHLHPQIEVVLTTLAETNPFHFGMSGSGATCFGLYENEDDAQKALTRVKETNPHYWAIATTTIAS